MMQTLKELIAIDSSTKDGANQAISYCANWLTKHNIQYQLLSSNGYNSLVATIGSGHSKLILNGHLDVVSGGPKQFKPFQQEDKLYGRGSVDMKAGVAAFLQLFKEVKDQPLRYTLELHLVPDEETGGKNGTKYLVDNGFLGDFVICSEPTNLAISLASKGILQIEIEEIGRAAHGSRPWLGENAILKSLETFSKISQLEFAKTTSDLLGKPSINLSKISGGHTINAVPDRCHSTYDIRFLPNQSSQQIIDEITKAIPSANITLLAEGAPVQASKSNPLIDKLIKEQDLKIIGQHGSADTRYYSAFGIEAIEFGPTGADWHGESEYVSISSIYKYLEILKTIVLA